jgi:hypothetical protein
MGVLTVFLGESFRLLVLVQAVEVRGFHHATGRLATRCFCVGDDLATVRVNELTWGILDTLISWSSRARCTHEEILFTT